MLYKIVAIKGDIFAKNKKKLLYNVNIHKIARSDRIGLTMKNSDLNPQNGPKMS